MSLYHVMLDRTNKDDDKPLDDGTYLAEFNTMDDAERFVKKYQPLITRLQQCNALDMDYKWILNIGIDDYTNRTDDETDLKEFLGGRKNMIIKLNERTYDLSDGSLNTEEPADTGHWSAEKLLCDIEIELNKNKKVEIKEHKIDPVKTNPRCVYYQDRLVFVENSDECLVDCFQEVNLDYWCCVELHAEQHRDKSVPYNLKQSIVEDDRKEKAFLADMWDGKIPYLTIKKGFLPCPLCSNLPPIIQYDPCSQKPKEAYCPICSTTIFGDSIEELMTKWNTRLNACNNGQTTI